ncbi:MAG: vWA domain-containing protein [Syntrophobacteraceae bacterium]
MRLRSIRSHYSFMLATACTLALMAQIICVGHCRAADTGGNNFIFILDASGSMWAKVQGRVKIDVAKEVLSGLIKDLPGTAKVGLVAFGHRQKGDCSDVEELAPLSPPDKEALVSIIRGINPKGMTPITFAVEKVAESLKGIQEETTIVLVSDGEETCKGDPCARVRELRASGIKFVMHVIGFDVNERQKAQLSCIAQAGGGFYFTARNAGELALAARKAVAKPERLPGTMTIRALSYGKPVRAYCEVFRGGGQDAQQMEKVTEGWIENGVMAYQLIPGVYDVKVVNREDSNKPSVDFQGITIEPGKNIEKVADFSGGILRIKALMNSMPCRAYSVIYKSGESEEKGEEKVTEGWTNAESSGFKLVPGVYDVIVENREDANKPTLSFKGIAIEAGKSIEKVAEFFGGALKVKALRNDKPFRAYCVIYKVVEDEAKDQEKVAEILTEIEGTVFKLAPGAYDVIVENQEDTDRPAVSFPGVTIEAGKNIERVADFSGGTLKVSAQRNGKPLSALCKIFKADGGDSKEKKKLTELWTGKDGTVLKLQPGVYDVVVENQEDAGRPSQSFSGIVIENGKIIERVAEFSGGTLKVKAVRNGKPFSAYCTVFTTGDGKEKEQVTNGWTGEEGAAFELLPGMYEITVENQSDANRPKLNFEGIAIEGGKSIERVAEFSGGTLKVKAVRNGKPFSAYCTVFTTGEGKEKEQVTNRWTGEEGAVFALLPGMYSLVIEDQSKNPREKKEVPEVRVEPDKIQDINLQF